ncbi:MAG: hypothetical protein WDZ63_03685 [Burkholderiales bacterium]
MKKSPGKPVKRKPAAPPAALRNPQLNLQTRKVLSKHYRAKHGVK